MDKYDWMELMRSPTKVMSESAKHVTDAIVLPGGLVVAIAGWMDVINKGLTLVVLLLTVVWTYYRILDLKDSVNKRRRSRR